MTEEQLDNELHTIVGACLLNNMVASSEACGRIRDAFYKERIKHTSLINAFYDHFINNGDEATLKQIMEAVNATQRSGVSSRTSNG